MTTDKQSTTSDKDPAKQGNEHSGAHAAKPGEEIKSRSADPGQSSYGGFSNEDPSHQAQQIDDTAQQKKGNTGSGSSGKD